MTPEFSEWLDKAPPDAVLRVQKIRQWSPTEAKEYWDYWSEKHLSVEGLARYWEL